MTHFLLRFAIAALGLWAASRLVSGFKIRGVGDLLAATLLLGIANAILRPILVFLTFPITLLTLGLFLLVINGLMVALVAALLKGVESKGLFPSILAAIVVGVVSWLGQAILHL